jgi:hypothetical protein
MLLSCRYRSMRSEDIKKSWHTSLLDSENTGYSLSEALIFASFKPKFDTNCLLNHEFSRCCELQIVFCSCFDIQNNL